MTLSLYTNTTKHGRRTLEWVLVGAAVVVMGVTVVALILPGYAVPDPTQQATQAPELQIPPTHHLTLILPNGERGTLERELPRLEWPIAEPEIDGDILTFLRCEDGKHYQIVIGGGVAIIEQL